MNLFDAVIKNDAKRVKYLLELGTDPNVCEDKAKITPLHFAAQCNSLDVVPLLLTTGADINKKTDDGETPLDVAELHGHDTMVRLLKKLQNRVIN